MSKRSLVFIAMGLLAFGLYSVVTAVAETKVPSSEIPAKREFPLSDKVAPCENFHQYVCSEVESSFKLREDRSSHDFAFSDSSERILEFKKKFFAGIQSEKNLDRQGQQLKDYYAACMNEKTGAKKEALALNEMVIALRKMKEPEEFVKFNVDNIKQGKPSLMEFDVDANKDNPLVYDLYLSAHLMNLPEHTYYDNSELMVDYKKLILDYFQFVEPGKKSDEYEARVNAMIALEKEFVAVYPHPEIRRQRWSEKRQMSQADFLRKYSNLHLEGRLAETPPRLFVTIPFPEALGFVNDKLNPENLQAWKDYYSYSVGRGYLDDSNAKHFQMEFDFNKKYLGGPNMRAVREERCTKRVMASFTKELDAVLLPRLFPNFPENKVQVIGSKIRESILAGLQRSTWLSAEAKAKALLKIQKAKLYLVKPTNEKEWDFTPVTKYSATDRIANSRLLERVLYRKRIKDIKSEVNQSAWAMGPLTVNAYYDSSSNKFVLPIGILQYPFFVAEGDLIENLGAVGSVFGHELGHGIDDQGSKYDEMGKLSRWMTMNDLKEFSTRGARMVEQFGKIGHNGSLTLGENVADLVGLTFAYNAAFPDGQGSIEDKKKFFVSYARVWCYVARPKADENQLKTNPHSLGWARINEQMKHQPGFAQAFSCQNGDKMVLPDSERVKIW